MTNKKTDKIFKSLYAANTAIITIALLLPLAELLVNRMPADRLLLSYYAVFLALSLAFCFSFLCINIWGMLRYKLHRIKYAVVTALFAVWFILGVYLILFSNANDIVL